MSVTIEVDNRQLENMSEEAKVTLNKHVNTYIDNIVKEANLIEEGNREDGAKREITSSIILQAVRKYKNNTPKQKDKWLIALKIISSFSLLIVGFLFDAKGYQDNMGKLIFFIIVLIIACISTVLQFVKEG